MIEGMAERGTIVLIEDEASIAEMLRSFFRAEGYRLVWAETGEDGLNRVGERSVLAVLLDLNLPGIDGMEVCRRLRARSDVPIIMLTARDDEIDKVLGLELGADDYVTKPFSPRELLARVRAVARRGLASPGDVITAGKWTIDRGRRAVTSAERLVRLTAKEFDLLWYLAEHAGLVMTRAQILEAVWGFEYFGETRTVDVHIRQLRKKLDDIPIETHWGVGYQLDA